MSDVYDDLNAPHGEVPDVPPVAMAGRCGTCRWWTPAGNEPAVWGTCELANNGRQEPIHPESLARADGNDGVWSWLDTQRDFGCVQWEAKP